MDNARYRYTPKEDEQLRSMWNDGVPTKEIAHIMRRDKTALMQRVAKLRKQGQYLLGFAERFEAVKDYKFHRRREREIAKLENPPDSEPEATKPIPETETPSNTDVAVDPGWTAKVVLSKDGIERVMWDTDLTNIVEYSVKLTKLIALITEGLLEGEL